MVLASRFNLVADPSPIVVYGFSALHGFLPLGPSETWMLIGRQRILLTQGFRREGLIIDTDIRENLKIVDSVTDMRPSRLKHDTVATGGLCFP